MKTKESIKEFLLITAGTAVVAAAVFFFLIPSHVPVGSISGLAIVLGNFIPMKISVITFVLNMVLLVLGFLFIGREFGAKTVYTSLLLPVFLLSLIHISATPRCSTTTCWLPAWFRRYP